MAKTAMQALLDIIRRNQGKCQSRKDSIGENIYLRVQQLIKIAIEKEKQQMIDARASMKLYALQPNGHGQASFFTIAENEEEARKAINKYVQENYVKNGNLDYRATGWGTNYYTLTVVGRGQVIENDND